MIGMCLRLLTAFEKKSRQNSNVVDKFKLYINNEFFCIQLLYTYSQDEVYSLKTPRAPRSSSPSVPSSPMIKSPYTCFVIIIVVRQLNF
jgi:hypothetical protein